MGTILFFEDDDIFAERTASLLSKDLGSSVKVELAKSILSRSYHRGRTFIDRLFNELKKLKDIDLIVADVNLYDIESYAGLSALLVSEVGKRLFIPVCVYSRKIKDDLEKMQESVDASIKLKSRPERLPEMSREIMHIYNGFTKIKKLYLNEEKRLKTESLPRVIAIILEKSEYVDKFSLYGLGNQGFLRLVPKLEKLTQKQRMKTVPYLLGNWLLLSVLKFPGILLNEVASASYLNISMDDFRETIIRKIFRRAIYKGPFSSLGSFWWRYELDEIIDQAKASNGLEYARNKTHRDVKPCKCSVDSKLDAGYYCIVTGSPVSLEKSIGEISWIPKGADLARVSLPVYNKLKPWIGIV
jgi:hypothetical protein